MKTKIHQLLPHLGALALLAAVPAISHAQNAAPPPPVAAALAAPAADNSYEAMEAAARRLAAGIRMPAEKQELALARLREAFLRGKIGAFAKDANIHGIFAYQMGEGGFLVKVKKGRGLAQLLGEARDLPLQLKSVTFGAQVGGGSEWGFGVILGLRSTALFGGEYKGDTRGATAGEESISITKLVRKGVDFGTEPYHEIYMIGAAAGLSAGAAIGNLTISIGS